MPQPASTTSVPTPNPTLGNTYHTKLKGRERGWFSLSCICKSYVFMSTKNHVTVFHTHTHTHTSPSLYIPTQSLGHHLLPQLHLHLHLHPISCCHNPGADDDDGSVGCGVAPHLPEHHTTLRLASPRCLTKRNRDEYSREKRKTSRVFHYYYL